MAYSGGSPAQHAVAAKISDAPYSGSSRQPLNTFATSVARSAGIGAPAQIHIRIDETSSTVGSNASRAMRTNGVAVAACVQRCSRMRARPSFGCHTSWRWIEPPVRMGTATPIARPVPWLTGARLTPHHNQLFQLGALGAQLSEHLQVIELAELAGRERDLRLRTLEDVADLVVVVDGHDRHQHRPGTDRRQVDDDELVPVGELDQDAVTTLHAQAAERGRKPVGLAAGFTVGEAAGAVGRKLEARRLGRPPVQVVEEDLVAPPAVLSEARGLFLRVPENGA